MAGRRTGGWLPYVVPAGILLLWEVLCLTKAFPETLLVPPAQVAATLWDMLRDGSLAVNMAASLRRVVIGYLLGAGAGLALGLALGFSATLDGFVGPTLDGIRQVPLYAWMPVIILLLGIGEASKVAFVAVGAFYPMLVNTIEAVRTVDPKHLEVARVYQYGPWQTLRRVVLPSSVPLLLSGARISLGMAWMMVVGAELFGADSGMGFLMTWSRQLFQTDGVLAGVVVIGLVGLGMDLLLRRLERRLLTWRFTRGDGN